MTRSEHVVCGLRSLEDGTADCMSTAISLEQPDMEKALNSSAHAAVGLSVDAAKPNLRLAAYMLSTMPEHVIAFILLCLHHQDSLVLEPITKFLAFLCPLFCCVKQLLRGDVLRAILKTSEAILKEELVYMREGDPDWIPIDPEDRRNAEIILEQTFYALDSEAIPMDDERREQFLLEDKARREEGTELLDFSQVVGIN